jgi:predicted nucleotidyltransferase
MTASRIQQQLEKRLREEGSDLISAYLFGSEAEDRAQPESDVDLGVLLAARFADPALRFEHRLALSARLGSGFGSRNLDLVVLNDAPPLLARHIVTRGRRLVCTDPEADHAFVRDVQLRAADLEPFVRRMRRIKLERMAGS